MKIWFELAKAFKSYRVTCKKKKEKKKERKKERNKERDVKPLVFDPPGGGLQ